MLRNWRSPLNHFVLVVAGAVAPVRAGVFTWGSNFHKTLGDGTGQPSRSLPGPVFTGGALGGKTVASISTGFFHALVTDTDENVFGWGNGNSGQFGDGVLHSSNVPLALTLQGALTGKRVVAMSAGMFHRLALTEDGLVAGWGANFHGAVGVLSTLDQSRPVSVTMDFFEGERVVGIAAGTDHSLAWTETGHVFAWGSNSSGQVGTGVPTSTYRLPNPGRVGTAAFANEFIVAAFGGKEHSLALTQDGRVFAWGGNEHGELGTGDTTPRPFPVEVQMTGALAGVKVKSIFAGELHSNALTADGRLLGWGSNELGQLGVGSAVVSSTVPVQTNASGPLAGKKIVAFTTRHHTLALTDDGKLFAWGANIAGEIGNGTLGTVYEPVIINATGMLAGRRIRQLAVGTGYSAVVTADAQIAVTGPGGVTLTSGVSVTDFGTVPAAAATVRAFAIRNAGFENVVIEGTSFSGPDAEHFAFASTPAETIAPGQSTVALVRFGPSPAGPRSAALTIHTNDLLQRSFVISLAANAVTMPAPATFGGLDPAFGGTGLLTVPVPAGTTLKAMKVQSDGKIVLAGSRNDNTFICRLLPDGALDMSFGGGGWVERSLSPGVDAAESLFIEDDGYILLAGRWDPIPAGYGDYLQRLFPDGTPDFEFGNSTGGAAITVHADARFTGLRTMLRHLPTDSIYSVASGGILRHQYNGTLHPVFGNDGILTVNPGLSTAAMAMDQEGKLLISRTGVSSNPFGVWRLYSDGQSDVTFGNTHGGGAFLFLPPNSSGVVREIAVLADGRILAGGSLTAIPHPFPRFGIGRFLPEGTPDPAFNNGIGWNAVNFQPQREEHALQLHAHRDGSALLTGYTTPANNGAGTNDIALARFLPDGTPDSAFGDGGKVLTDSGLWETTVASSLLPGGARRALILGSFDTTATPAPGSASAGYFLAQYRVRVIPDLAVTDPDDTPLTNHAPPSTPAAVQELGLIAIGSRSRQFTLRNIGEVPLTALTATLTDESHPGQFAVSTIQSATLAPGGQMPCIVTCTPSSAPGPRTATLRLTSSDPDKPEFLIPVAAVKATPLEIWRITWFGSPDNSGPGADLNDFDGDELTNIVEFVTGSHPHLFNPTPGTLTLSTSGGAPSFTFTRLTSAFAGVSCHVQTAPAPGGPWSGTGVTETILSSDSTTQTIKATLPAGKARLFLRLSIFRP